MDESHFIPLHSALKLKKLFSVRKAIFKNHFLLCCISFCLLVKILLVSRIQTNFARHKRSGYARLARWTFSAQSVLRKSFWLVPCLENIIVHKMLLLMPHAFTFRQFFPNRKAFADIHRNDGLVRSVMIRQRRISSCNKPVITWPLGCLANLLPSGALHPHVIN